MTRLPVPIAVAVAVVAMLALALVGTFTGSTAAPLAAPVVAMAPVTSTTLVCPNITSKPVGTTSRAEIVDVAGALSPPSHSAGTVTETVLDAAKSKTAALHVAPTTVVPSVAKTNQTVALTATGSIAATLAGDVVTETLDGSRRALSGVSCEAPATDWWFAGADGRVGYADTLLLANPSPTPSLVSISLWGSKGPLLSSRLGILRIGAESHLAITIANHAPDIALIALHVHAESGAVAASLFDARTSALQSDGSDYLPATQPPARSSVVAGFVTGKGPHDLVIANPGSADATVALRLVTVSGSFTPSGVSPVVIRAGHTTEISLDRAFDGTAGAVQLTSDQPVVAEGLSVTTAPPHRPDLMWLAATAPISGPAAIPSGRPPNGGHTLLVLSAPQAAGQVRVSTIGGQPRTIAVAAGHSVQVDITSAITSASGDSPFVVTPLAGGPVYGVRVLSLLGSQGALTTDEPLVALPTSISLPPVHQDQLIATR